MIWRAVLEQVCREKREVRGPRLCTLLIEMTLWEGIGFNLVERGVSGLFHERQELLSVPKGSWERCKRMITLHGVALWDPEEEYHYDGYDWGLRAMIMMLMTMMLKGWRKALTGTLLARHTCTTHHTS